MKILKTIFPSALLCFTALGAYAAPIDYSFPLDAVAFGTGTAEADIVGNTATAQYDNWDNSSYARSDIENGEIKARVELNTPGPHTISHTGGAIASYSTQLRFQKDDDGLYSFDVQLDTVLDGRIEGEPTGPHAQAHIQFQQQMLMSLGGIWVDAGTSTLMYWYDTLISGWRLAAGPFGLDECDIFGCPSDCVFWRCNTVQFLGGVRDATGFDVEFGLNNWIGFDQFAGLEAYEHIDVLVNARLNINTASSDRFLVDFSQTATSAIVVDSADVVAGNSDGFPVALSNPADIPEPSAFGLVSLGAIIAFRFQRRKKTRRLASRS